MGVGDERKRQRTLGSSREVGTSQANRHGEVISVFKTVCVLDR
jgi:hypothetical protein